MQPQIKEVSMYKIVDMFSAWESSETYDTMEEARFFTFEPMKPWTKIVPADYQWLPDEDGCHEWRGTK